MKPTLIEQCGRSGSTDRITVMNGPTLSSKSTLARGGYD